MEIWLKLFSIAVKKYTDLLRQYFFISGTILAIIISWQSNSSLIWAPIHGLFGWIYIFYFLKNWIMFSFFVTVLVIYIGNFIKDVLSVGTMYNKIKSSLEKK